MARNQEDRRNLRKSEMACGDDAHAASQYVGDGKRPPFYAAGMFAYPSGKAHLGHVRVYTLADAVARYQRLLGKDVLNPVGWDAFGLPAENAAKAHGVSPADWTAQNIRRMRDEQFKPLGWSFDWSRELSTADPDYYRWTQWLFIKLLERGLAYRKEAAVSWCTRCETTLAQEQVAGGRCWRCDEPVIARRLKQWFFRLTRYADHLWDDLELLDAWDKNAVAVQRHWLGREEGIRLRCPVKQYAGELTAFMDRPELIFDVAALLLAPEHPLVDELCRDPASATLRAYVEHVLVKSGTQRQRDPVSGVRTGCYVQMPLDGRDVEIIVCACVVDASEAFPCIPAHSERDAMLAAELGLEVPRPGECGSASGDWSSDSASLSGSDARQAVITALAEAGAGNTAVHYRVQDWSVSRQRRWGCPVPMIHCVHCGAVPSPEDSLPMLVSPTAPVGAARTDGQPSASSITCPRCGLNAERDPDTLDTFVCSSWYLFRFVDPHNSKAPFSSEKVNRVMPVDFYVGGIEHAAQHLLYLRFITKVLKDLGLVDFPEPVSELYCNGMVRLGGKKMSKSRGNVVDPAEIVAQHGADALRLYILGDTPGNWDLDWYPSALPSRARFIRRLRHALATYLSRRRYPGMSGEVSTRDVAAAGLVVFYAAVESLKDCLEQREFHKAVAQLHTAASALLKALREDGRAHADSPTLDRACRDFLVASSPLIPQFAEELWRDYFATCSLIKAGWPRIPDFKTAARTVPIVVQVDGKKRAVIDLSAGCDEETLVAAAITHPAVARALTGRNVLKRIVLPGKLLNLVTGPKLD